jgi:hypothetical protein
MIDKRLFLVLYRLFPLLLFPLFVWVHSRENRKDSIKIDSLYHLSHLNLELIGLNMCKIQPKSQSEDFSLFTCRSHSMLRDRAETQQLFLLFTHNRKTQFKIVRILFPSLQFTFLG